MHHSPYDMATRLKFLRISLGMHQAELAEKADLSQRQISLYESGKSSPRANTIQRLAFVLGKSKDWLLYGDDESDFEIAKTLEHGKDSAPRSIPLATWAEASAKFIGPRDSYVYGPSWISHNAFALFVHGLSMAPDYPPGSIIVVDPDISPQSGDDVVAFPDLSLDEPMFGRLSLESHGRMALVPLNAQYPATIAEKSGRVIGVVVMQIYYRLNQRQNNEEQ
ncbi:LexA family transcriptional regulator [Halomonas sp. ISL-60]|uniref:LexA family transcriptional regulator n=1 Tax=Halomonas sp. ISL-56 TaxID=2819149 RepID=UPI001BE94992|nr:LexA family transcriptional regulator [Halomonas sp. ISL-56]MBT2772906.1 LexA family transcriptional regulator [Halomonas sp. ISL-60]MBT2799953.1 LexA family transcriptional regulator [Halomonas sp. ISL-56]